MKVTSIPVIAATKFIIETQRTPPSKLEGLDHCTKLIEWVSSDHADNNEAVNLVQFLGKTLLNQKVISEEEFQELSGRVMTSFQRVGVTTRSPVHEITHQEVELQRQGKLARQTSLDAFERLIQWMSVYEGSEDTTDYGCSLTTLFSIVIDCYDEGLINAKEKIVLFNRAYQVIMKDPNRTIADEDLVDFLRFHVIPECQLKE